MNQLQFWVDKICGKPETRNLTYVVKNEIATEAHIFFRKEVLQDISIERGGYLTKFF